MPTNSRSELIEIQKKLQAVYPAVREELMRIPGVVKVGIGIKEVAGSLTGEMVFRVYVQEKKPLPALPPEERVPKEIRGFKTDVIIVRPERPETDESRERPLMAGVQINRSESSEVGTLGLFAHLVSDNSVLLVSNHHVLYGPTPTSGFDGQEIGQPEYETSCCCTCGDVAANVHGIRRDHLDCAIARLKSGVTHNPEIKEIGAITGIANAVPGEAVKKRGRTTDLTTGNISNLTFDAGGTKLLEIEVKKDNGNARFSRGGDSGSALLNSSNQIIGLHKSGNNDDDVTPGDFLSTSIGIQEVLDAFDAEGFQITLITGSGGGESAHPAHIQTASLSDAMWALEVRLRESEKGRELWGVMQRHKKELIGLVNYRRPVTVIWHRNKGPTFLAALARSLKEPAYQVPAEIEGIRRPAAARAILSVLEQHGSTALRTELQTYSSLLIGLFVRCSTVEDLILGWESALRAAPTAQLESVH